MKREHPSVYQESEAEAVRRGETQMYEDSSRLNVSCARAIERAIRDYFDGNESLCDGCAQSVLEEYGAERVGFVLANTMQNVGCRYYHSDEVLQWSKDNRTPSNGKYDRYFTVDTAAGLLDAFIGQFQQANQALDESDQEQTGAPAQGGMEMR